MLNDGYEEQVVKTKTPGGVILGMVIGGAAVVLGICALMVMPAVGLIAVIAGALLFGVFVTRRETEYEYIMVNEDIDVAKIVAKRSRKKLYSFSNGDVRLIARAESIYLDNELQQDSSIKTKDYTSKDKEYEDGVYVFVVSKNGKTEFVRLELSDRTIDHVNTFFKGKYKE